MVTATVAVPTTVTENPAPSQRSWLRYPGRVQANTEKAQCFGCHKNKNIYETNPHFMLHSRPTILRILFVTRGYYLSLEYNANLLLLSCKILLYKTNALIFKGLTYQIYSGVNECIAHNCNSVLTK